MTPQFPAKAEFALIGKSSFPFYYVGSAVKFVTAKGVTPNGGGRCGTGSN
jgi:hypothetical protein